MLLSGAEIIIETLIEQGVTDVFGYPGGSVLNIYDELYKNSDRIHHTLTAHEQGASHAADGYFRATGKTGVCIATSGPGATNLVTGIATAMLDSVAMVAITGNVSCDLIGKDSFQEIDIVGVTQPVTKHNYFVRRVEDLADTIREAFRIARSGRPGPVLIDVPKDVQINKCEYEHKKPEPLFEADKAKDEDIQKAIEIINNAKRPYIYVGGGVIGTGIYDEVVKLADKIDAVIGCTLMGISAIPTSCDRFLGMQGMHGHFASSVAQNNADMILAIGVRFSDRATGNKSKYCKGAKIVQIDIDFSEINKNIMVDVGIVGDVADAFGKIAAGVAEHKNPEWMAAVAGYKATEAAIAEKAKTSLAAAGKANLLTPQRAFEIINSIIDDDTVIATDVGQHQMWTAQYCNFGKVRKFVSSGGLGTMGFGMGSALGAATGSKDRTVLITGDGSFGMNLNELATAVSYNIPITIVIMNNGVLGMVRQWQTLFYQKHYSNTTLNRKTDFIKLADAFGLKGIRATTPEEFEQAFKEGFETDAPVLIDCLIDQDEFVLPMLPPGGSMDQIITEKGE
ncbi:MAG: biosynthetic-type acetolactate synthase large subunit [Faecalibacterium sp.]|nr:biosynthetic-type acetolactate synthase large subunit [Ruminococcus sp.]MCM1392713.1 biosynthetic-type acetolactate synthase large subunit [Ruminococcus sp.]MCM1485293.1 biosynthetic-type acetolactate synthase large subunit [Faecalibacterium sp.]